eukprot:scaffold12966_cov38-Attheya_sp.AAC.1
MPWSHACAQWGARVWGVVSCGERSLSAVRGYYPDAQMMVPEECRSFSEGRMWRGVFAFTWGRRGIGISLGHWQENVGAGASAGSEVIGVLFGAGVASKDTAFGGVRRGNAVLMERVVSDT